MLLWFLNSPFVSNKIFLEKAIDIISMYLLVTFTVQNFKKILRADPVLWGCPIFGLKMAHLPEQGFFGKNH